jgi:hypothetical protein
MVVNAVTGSCYFGNLGVSHLYLDCHVLFWSNSTLFISKFRIKGEKNICEFFIFMEVDYSTDLENQGINIAVDEIIDDCDITSVFRDGKEFTL